MKISLEPRVNAILEAIVVVNDEEKRLAHPGWAVKFEDGTWLCIAHGAGMVVDAFYARTWATEKEAESEVLHCIKDQDIPNVPYKVIPAWEPLCESLRVRIGGLIEANKIEPGDIMEMTWQLEEVIRTLSGK